MSGKNELFLGVSEKKMFVFALAFTFVMTFILQELGQPTNNPTLCLTQGQMVHPLLDTLDETSSVSNYWILSLFCKAFLGASCQFLEGFWTICLPLFKIDSSCLSPQNWTQCWTVTPFADLGLDQVIVKLCSCPVLLDTSGP